jgi:hypothetical protein
LHGFAPFGTGLRLRQQVRHEDLEEYDLLSFFKTMVGTVQDSFDTYDCGATHATRQSKMPEVCCEHCRLVRYPAFGLRVFAVH